MNFSSTLLICLLILSNIAWSGTIDNDRFQAIQMQRNGLSHLLTYMDNQPDIFDRPIAENVLLDIEQKHKVLNIWFLYLDYMTTLDTLSDQSTDAIKVAATIAHYRFALEFIKRAGHDPEIVKLLNLKQKKQGLKKNFYRRFQNEMLGEYRTRQFEEMRTAYHAAPKLGIDPVITADLNALNSISRLRLLAGNQKKKIKHSLYRAYYPLQKGIARGMGKIKVWRIGTTLITPDQALMFSESFEPGDFYLTRKEWRMTNVGIPGFWTHSALYIGTARERAVYFNSKEVNDWVHSKGYATYEQLLKSTSKVFSHHSGYDALGEIRVLEALDAGVIFNSIETSLDADGAAVFRPRLSRLEKAKAIYNAFHYIGRPYDFHFDFDSDDALVCSELIYKSYQQNTDQHGIQFPLNRSVGKKMLTPNEIARWFDETVDTPAQQIDLVMFIDSNERDRVAFQSTQAAFIGTWKRPDWYIFNQPKYVSNNLIAQTR